MKLIFPLAVASACISSHKPPASQPLTLEMKLVEEFTNLCRTHGPGVYTLNIIRKKRIDDDDHYDFSYEICVDCLIYNNMVPDLICRSSGFKVNFKEQGWVHPFCGDYSTPVARSIPCEE